MEILDQTGWLWGLSLIVLTMAIHATAVVMLAFVGDARRAPTPEETSSRGLRRQGDRQKMLRLGCRPRGPKNCRWNVLLRLYSPLEPFFTYKTANVGVCVLISGHYLLQGRLVADNADGMVIHFHPIHDGFDLGLPEGNRA
jgi:hypothetical protein